MLYMTRQLGDFMQFTVAETVYGHGLHLATRVADAIRRLFNPSQGVAPIS